tara:strand:+ start:410 stop:1174 length:765 start_codon:yes stop_codon:yes gene_type:complete
MSKKKKVFEIKKMILTFLSFSLLGLMIKVSFLWASYSGALDLDHIKFSETKILDVSNYRSLLGEITNEKSKELNLYEISTLIESHPYVKYARVSRHYPSEIKIEIIERKPIAIVNMNPMIFLDENGFVLPVEGIQTNYNLPVMNNFNSEPQLYPLGELALSVKVKEAIALISKIKKDYSDLYNNLSELKISSSNEIELILSDLPTHIYLGNEKIGSRIHTLKEFESKLKPNKMSDFSYLDMRYDNQIIGKRRHL